MRRKLLIATLLSGSMAFAQDLPAPSPSATVQQRIGLTDFTVEYSRPSMKEREIFGALVPYGEMWRTGANANTTVEFSSPVMIGDNKLEAGKYSLITIPNENEWTIILNKKTDMWGTGNYDEAQDAMRMMAKPMKGEKTETFTIGFTDLTAETGNITLRWANTIVNIPVKVKVKEIALKNIDKAIEEAEADKKWRVYRNAASYYYNNKMDMAKAMDYMEMSIKLNENNWYSHWLLAEILAERGMNRKAVASANKAIEIGKEEAEKNDTQFSYQEMIEEKIAEWKADKLN